MHDLVVVGAGPYGLSIAAHAAAAGLDLRVLGRPMASWRDHMPGGMFLKSEPWSSNLSDPSGTHTLAAWCAERGLRADHGVPLPISTFTDYGMWFAGRLRPTVEERLVVSVAPMPGGYRVETADGELFTTRTVVVAAGVMPFVHTPHALRGLSPHLASHSSSHADLAHFRDREVTVIGGGQAALETAALLLENGARPTVVARASTLRWNTPPQPLRRGLRETLREPHSGLGTGWSSWVWSEVPGAVRVLPTAMRTHIASTALGPAGAWWLRDRVVGRVPIRLRRQVVTADPVGDRLRLRVTGPSGYGPMETVETDHVIAATGFVPDVNRLNWLAPELRVGVRRVRGTGAPELGAHFESSRPGLFFAGLPAAPSFGPSMRFVHGATFTAGRLVRGVRRRLGGRPLHPGIRVPAPAPAPSAGVAEPAAPTAPVPSPAHSAPPTAPVAPATSAGDVTLLPGPTSRSHGLPVRLRDQRG
ncbi:NAD(P)-binding domain-containing protein [Streptomyces sp. ST2-7A]|uniref:NAD(P)-binding domain-containing protein n=1 Tax=Streptomyces sp. ST2-7A TaxID=2907214 RepID=UPI001F2F08AA|nr:NAD(P)-binding domain-containing protein [Streptomyces sp. ST2-7A]MCE7080666.1 NAD(P)-binding domain-containing protein [Streptomyces sp. ST2-7A]